MASVISSFIDYNYRPRSSSRQDKEDRDDWRSDPPEGNAKRHRRRAVPAGPAQPQTNSDGEPEAVSGGYRE